jgi:hypothetical protein
MLALLQSEIKISSLDTVATVSSCYLEDRYLNNVYLLLIYFGIIHKSIIRGHC